MTEQSVQVLFRVLTETPLGWMLMTGFGFICVMAVCEEIALARRARKNKAT